NSAVGVGYRIVGSYLDDKEEMRDEVLHAILAAVEFREGTIPVPIDRAKGDSAFVGGFGVGKTLHLFVHTGHSYQSVGIAWIDVQDFLKFSQSEIVLTEILVQEAQRDEHGRQVLVDFDGFATICKSLLNGGR